MASKIIRKGLKRTALSVALGMCFASTIALAQSAVGSIYGQTKQNSTVTIVNTGTGVSREISADASGRFAFGQLPPGVYKVTSGGVTREVSVSVGTGTNVSLAGGDVASLGTVQVIGSGAVNSIDVSSVESNTVITEEMIDRLPVGRNVAAVALLAPGTTRSQTFGSNAISFGGSSPAENGYYINGFNVTNIRSGLAYNEVPFEGIAETQVKTGGYGAEFGRSLGGVTNVITKRGTNDWKFSVGATWAPDSLRAPTLHADGLISPLPTGTPGSKNWTLTESNNTADSLIYTVAAGGPIIKDRLFVYALYQGDQVDSDSYGTQSISGAQVPKRHDQFRASNDQYMVKLDWNITDNHLLELTAFRDKNETVRTRVSTLTDWGTNDNPSSVPAVVPFLSGGDNYSLRWTGYLTDNFTLSALAGDGTYISSAVVPNTQCPYVFDHRDNSQHGCAASPSYNRADEGDSRRAYRVDAEWVLGDHTFRFGLDQEKIHSIAQNVASGGLSYDVYTIADVEDLPPTVEAAVPLGTTHIVLTREFSNGGEFDTTNTAWYAEDRWQLTDNLLVYGGIRNESFENLNADGLVFAKVDNTWAPRFGFSWDVAGDGKSKMFGTGGRYYIPIYTNTNVRLSGAELDIQRYYTSNGTFTGGEFDLPNTGVLLGTVVQSDGVAGDPRSVVDNNLSPMFQDEYILGFQTQLSDKWSAGVRAIYRSLGSGMDDYCAYQRPYDWAASEGYATNEADEADGAVTSESDAVGEAISHCFLTNPGNELSMNVDLDGAGPDGLTTLIIPTSAMGVPNQERTYKALEVFFERAWDDKWTMQGSYTWSKNYGNTEGYVNSDIGQGDAGITSDFDFAEFTENAYGYTPNDRRHTLKMFGAYNLNEEWSFGANLLVQSGRLKSCLGSYNGSIDPEDPTLYPGYAFFCDFNLTNSSLIADGIAVQRGTYGRNDWQRTLGLQVGYSPKWAEGLHFAIDVFNVMNESTVVSNRSRSLPSSQAQQPLTWQAPRSIRLSVSYNFDLK